MYAYLDDVQQILKNFGEECGIIGRSFEFHERHIMNFFRGHMSVGENQDRQLEDLTYRDIDEFLSSVDCSDADRMNYYNSFKRFFNYTYLNELTGEIMLRAIKPRYDRSVPRYLNDMEYVKLKQFITSPENDLNDRLVIGLFLFTGLSRSYIASMTVSQFVRIDGRYFLQIWNKKNEEVILPLRIELQLIINEYMMVMCNKRKFDKVVSYADDNRLSTYISGMTLQIVGEKYTPTHLSNTFIQRALLRGNHVWEVSNLTLESISIISNHISSTDALISEQSRILDSF